MLLVFQTPGFLSQRKTCVPTLVVRDLECYSCIGIVLDNMIFYAYGGDQIKSMPFAMATPVMVIEVDAPCFPFMQFGYETIFSSLLI